MNIIQLQNTDNYYATGVEKMITRILSPRISRTVYDSKNISSLSLYDYITRWTRYTECGSVPVLMAVIYIDRFCIKTRTEISMTNLHRLALAALLVATKYADDYCFSNKYYARIGGVSPEELNILEEKFLGDVGWNLFVSNIEMLTYIKALG